MRFLIFLLLPLAAHAQRPAPEETAPEYISSGVNRPKPSEIERLLEAEQTSSPAGRAVLETGRYMALEERTVVKGSCWDYVQLVYQRAGYAAKRRTVFKKPKSGPYADPDALQPGDWLYYINYSYNMIEHSGIFVCWEDYDRRLGVILSYAGQQRQAPGRYRTYDLSRVYTITRPGS
jgi:hypothetical protein